MLSKVHTKGFFPLESKSCKARFQPMRVFKIEKSNERNLNPKERMAHATFFVLHEPKMYKFKNLHVVVRPILRSGLTYKFRDP